METRKQVFISYAHEDTEWKDRFERMFAPACSSRLIDVWSDTLIAPGENWREKIERALRRADVALLLVSDRFFDSKFIAEQELARFLKMAEKEKVQIRWVPVTPSLYQCSQLSDIQACCNPGRPLSKLPEADQSDTIQKICYEIVNEFANAPRVRQSVEEGLREQIQVQLGKKFQIEEKVASGKYAVIYRAHRLRPKRTVGVKTFVGSEIDEWVRRAFRVAVERAMTVTSPAFIKIYDYVEGPPDSVVTEFVHARSLDEVLKESPDGLPLSRVKSILLDLAGAIAEAHGMKWLRGEMCPSDVLVEHSGAARLPALDCSNILREQSLLAGNFLVDTESLAYMTPERYYGKKYTELTDQYSLGLIATELLGGPSAPPVVSPCDLERKPELFIKLESGDGPWVERSPELVGVVRRMLRREPELRWPSMSVVRRLIQEIEVPEERERKRAKASYLRLQAEGPRFHQDFYRVFYKNLFAAAPDVKKHFVSVEMASQHEHLNNAVHALLDFRPDSEDSKERLRRLATSHARFRLEKKHFESFITAFVETLTEFGRHPKEIDAWRGPMRMGLEYMWECHQKGAPEDVTEPTGAKGRSRSSPPKRRSKQVAAPPAPT